MEIDDPRPLKSETSDAVRTWQLSLRSTTFVLDHKLTFARKTNSVCCGIHSKVNTLSLLIPISPGEQKIDLNRPGSIQTPNKIRKEKSNRDSNKVNTLNIANYIIGLPDSRFFLYITLNLKPLDRPNFSFCMR